MFNNIFEDQYINKRNSRIYVITQKIYPIYIYIIF